MSFCLPIHILTAVPYVIGLVLIGLVALMGMYVWRELSSHVDGGRAELNLLVGLLIISVIVIVFFVAFAIINLTVGCAQQSKAMATQVHIRYSLAQYFLLQGQSATERQAH